jgi:hypothetical protein
MTPLSDERRAALIAAVTSYLTLCERRELSAAGSHLAPDAVLIFPGGRRYPDLESMASAGDRVYARMHKRMDRFDAFVDDEGREVVVSLGTLEGELADGRRFDGVRYLDRFVVVNGAIILQEVWNDLAVLGFVPRSAQSHN